MKRILPLFAGMLMSICLLCPLVVAQTTAFTYQGSLNASGTPANGNHDFEFALFSAAGGGTQHGATLTRSGVSVANGVFTVSLDFGNQFPDSERFLEIRVRPSGGGAFTTLEPRQLLNSSPYSITSFNSNRLGGVPASLFLTSNQTTLTALTQFNIGANRVLSVGGTANTIVGVGAGSSNSGQRNSFFGDNAGNANATGSGNSFFGSQAGAANTTGANNSFFGINAGEANTTGGFNTFVGSNAGKSNTTGPRNSIFGNQAGQSNTTGDDNSFFGIETGLANTSGRRNSFYGAFAGRFNTIGDFNSFVGAAAGSDNTTGIDNSFFGASAGANNTTGSANSFFGRLAGLGNVFGSGNSYFGANSNSSDGLTNAAAIGSRAFVTQSNSLILGSINGTNGAIADTNVGIGTTAPARRLHVANGVSGAVSISSAELVIEDDAAVFQHFITPNDAESGILFGDPADSIGGGIIFNNAATNNGILFRTGGNTTRMTLNGSGQLGIGVSPADALDVNGIIRVASLGSAGATTLCRNASNQIATCSSSMRYKSNVNPFSAGLSLIKRLRPVSFNWKEGDTALDFGLVAEEVARVEPLLTTTRANGEIEGVKYDRVGVVLVNAVKEQQAQIERQQKQIDEQTETINSLKTALCELNSQLAVCKGDMK